jgi:PKHD-type hydroxylase
MLTTDPYLTSNFTLPIVHLDNIFTNKELDSIVNYCETYEVHESTVGTDRIKKQSTRQSDIKFHNIDQHNHWIFERLLDSAESINQQFYNFELSGFNYFQYTTYNNIGSHYDFHVDIMYGNRITHWSEVMPKKLSFSLILSDPKDYTGGDFEIMVDKDPTIIEQPKGRLLAFPSFILHKVSPIISGSRKSLVFWVLGPKFK